MQEVALRALARAIDLVGRAGVAQALGVSEESIDLWVLKKAAIPGRVFSALTDLLIEQDLARNLGQTLDHVDGPPPR